MDRGLLQEYLEQELSLQRIGELTGRHPSTVGYWVRKHGLRAAGAERYAAKGALDRDLLASLVAAGLTQRDIAAALDRSVATVRHWLGRHGLHTERAAQIRAQSNQSFVARTCPRHGPIEFRRSGARGHYRCRRCESIHVSKRRRRIKEILVAEAGGACANCGYDRYQGALQFHHVDPATKIFSLGHKGIGRSLARAREEARKCVLLCANCHAEVEGGLVTLRFSASAVADPG